MFVTRIRGRRRSTLHRLARLQSGIGWNDGGGDGGNAGDAKKDEKKDAKEGADKGDAGKLTLTQAELDAKVQAATKAALADAQKKSDDAAKKKADDDEKKRLADEGKFKDLADGEKTKREAAEAELATERRDRKIDKALIRHASKAEGYPFEVFEKYVLPSLTGAIASDATDDAIDKATKEAVDTYVKDNPREVKKGSGLPNDPKTPNRQNKGGNNGGERKNPNALSNGNRIVPAASRF